MIRSYGHITGRGKIFQTDFEVPRLQSLPGVRDACLCCRLIVRCIGRFIGVVNRLIVIGIAVFIVRRGHRAELLGEVSCRFPRSSWFWCTRAQRRQNGDQSHCQDLLSAVTVPTKPHALHGTKPSSVQRSLGSDPPTFLRRVLAEESDGVHNGRHNDQSTKTE